MNTATASGTPPASTGLEPVTDTSDTGTVPSGNGTVDPLTDAEMATLKTVERNCRLIKGQVFLWEGAKDWHDLWDEDGVIVK